MRVIVVFPVMTILHKAQWEQSSRVLLIFVSHAAQTHEKICAPVLGPESKVRKSPVTGELAEWLQNKEAK